MLAITDVTETSRVDAMRRDFVSSASHELKTPVAAILASAEALQMALARDPASARRFGEQIERLARQLAKLVADLLDLSRLEASTPDHELVRLDQVAEEEVNRFRGAAESAGLKLTSSSSVVSVSGSRRDLGLAIRNLLDNAIRHTPDGGAIDLRLRSDNGDAVVEVVDSGEGIPKTGATPDLRAVLPGRYSSGQSHRWHRIGPGHRPPCRRGPWRIGPGRKRTRPGFDLQIADSENGRRHRR